MVQQQSLKFDITTAYLSDFLSVVISTTNPAPLAAPSTYEDPPAKQQLSHPTPGPFQLAVLLQAYIRPFSSSTCNRRPHHL